MTYALVVKGAVAEYPYSFAALRKANPDVSFPRDPSDDRLAEFGVVKIAATERPAANDPITENVVEATPELIKGVWTQAWSVVPATAEQIAKRQANAVGDADRVAVKADTFVTNFIAMTPAEVSAYIEANVTNFASAKNTISKLALMVLLLARREFRDE